MPQQSDAAAPEPGWHGSEPTPPRRVRLIVAVTLILLVTSLLPTPAGQAVLRSVGLAAPARPLTALAFADPDALPDRYLAEPRVRVVRFQVQNQSDRSRRYDWQLRVTRGTAARGLATGDVAVPAGTWSTVTVVARVTCSGVRQRMEVRLVEPPRSINFWVRCLEPSKER